MKRKHKKKLCPYCQIKEIYIHSKRCRKCYVRMEDSSQFHKGYTPWNKGLHGEDNPRWKGGFYNIYKNGKSYNISREIVAKVLGRELTSLEFVHHINFNQKDNRHENLLVCSQGYHRGLHNKIKARGLVDYFKSLSDDKLFTEESAVKTEVKNTTNVVKNTTKEGG